MATQAAAALAAVAPHGPSAATLVQPIVAVRHRAAAHHQAASAVAVPAEAAVAALVAVAQAEAAEAAEVAVPVAEASEAAADRIKI